jgi:ribosomal-protein-alanine N-acetyltransferase
MGSGDYPLSVPEAAMLRYVPLQEEHLDEVTAIELEAYPEPWTREMFVQEIHSDRAHFYVAYLAEFLAGYGGFWLVCDEAHITSVTARDRFRGRGFGRQILQFVLGVAAGLGVSLATLEVRASNFRAQNLYLSEGFRLVGARKGYYARSNEDALVMLKEPI